jgi:hypothetical protein
VPEGSPFSPWRIAGSYFEACSCLAICPCRRIGGRRGGRSTFGVCDFVLSWWIEEGAAAGIELAGLKAVMVGSYGDDEPGSPWRVALYVDEQADPEQCAALEAILLGRSGGTAFRNFASKIFEVHTVRQAALELDHRRGRERIVVGAAVEVVAGQRVATDETVSCGIPGHDHPGEEVYADLIRVAEPPLVFEVERRTGFATDFDYRWDKR